MNRRAPIISTVAAKSAALVAGSIIALAAASPGFAQTQPAAGGESAVASIESDIATAKELLESGDYDAATSRLRAATDSANRLKLQAIAAQISRSTASFTPENQRFALSASSTLTFENFLKDREFAEQIFKDEKGNVVTVRVVGDPDSLKDFEFIADDPAMASKAGVELAEMRGEPALKKRGSDGSLSVLMMSEADHALIEVEGASEEAVMALVADLEKADKK